MTIAAESSTLQSILNQVLEQLVALKITPKMSFYNAINVVQDLMVRRLVTIKSELLFSLETSEQIAASGSTCTLPFGFIGFKEKPYISGLKYARLTPLLPETREDFTEPSTPLYFEVTGRTLTVYPPTKTAIYLKLPVYKKPDKITALRVISPPADIYTPFNGLADTMLVDGTLRVLAEGVALLTDPGFIKEINSYVEEILPAHMGQRISWGRTYEGGQRKNWGYGGYWPW